MPDRARGYQPRDYREFPEGYNLPSHTAKAIPSSEWRERIDYLNSISAQPVHWHKSLGKRAIQNQRSSNYCWMYGTVAAMINSLATQGVGFVNLNPYAVAYLGKRGANRGGFGAEACEYLDKYGCPTKSALPEFTKTLRWTSLVKANARQHKICEFSEIGSDNFDAVVSNLIGDDPAPCTVAFSWWRHLVCALGVTYNSRGNYGLIVVNSWGSKWADGGESGGYGIIWGAKAVPHEAIAVRSVLARKESS